MNTGYVVAVIGIVALIAGIGMYMADWHHTIGLGLVGIGIILVVLGVWYSRRGPTKAPPQAPTPPKP